MSGVHRLRSVMRYALSAFMADPVDLETVIFERVRGDSYRVRLVLSDGSIRYPSMGRYIVTIYGEERKGVAARFRLRTIQNWVTLFLEASDGRLEAISHDHNLKPVDYRLVGWDT
uniref:Uncharacterized protein n=1 Tax=Caulobacter phage BL57 TaxID=3348355 RepID=A0AB74UHD9_9VIRU